MKLLVTGATGFIGGALIRAAIRDGHEVAGLVRHPASAKHLGYRIIPGSLENPDWKAIEEFSPDSCLHAAWIATPGAYLNAPENDPLVETSARFLERLVELGVAHLTAIGTCLEYAPSADDLGEAAPLGPVSPYARAKCRLHHQLLEADLRFCWARLFYPYGPGEDSRRLPTSLIRKIGDHEEIALLQPDSVRDYIFIDDVSAALLLFLTTRFVGTANIGTGNGVAIRDLAASAASVAGQPLRLRSQEPAPDPFPRCVSRPQALERLGWRPQCDLETGFKQLAESLGA